MTLPEQFNAATHFVDRHLTEGRGAAIAIECGDERVSYQQVAERVNRFGSALRSLGIQPEQRIALILQDTPAFAYAFFGAIKIGAVPVPLNTLWRAQDYRHALADSGARVLVISEALLREFLAIDRQALPRLEHVVVVGPSAKASTSAKATADKSDGKQLSGAISFDALLAGGAPALEAEATHRDAMAFWLYSSGSTGGPKGCVHLQHDMFVCAEAYAKGVLQMRASDRCFSVAKLFFAYGLGNALYMPFAVGATAILMPDPPAAARVFETIERCRPTLFFSVPTNYGMLLAHQRDGSEFDLSSIRYAVSAGEALPESLYRRFHQRFGVEILDAIGSTECLHMFIANRPGQVRPGSSGRPVPGYEARIVDDDDRPVPAGEMGNLLIKGDSTCAYYWNQHDKTKQTIQGEWIRTGDKYYCDADGFYWYGGRTDDMLKAGGIWVSPVEIENVLIDHDAVQECAVIGRDDVDGLSKPFAYVVLRENVSGSPELAAALQQFVRERLADYKRPRGVEFVAELPKTATGKLQRFKLRAAASG